MAAHGERAPLLQSARGLHGQVFVSLWTRCSGSVGGGRKRLHARPSLGRVERAQRWWCGPATLVSPRLVFDRQIGPTGTPPLPAGETFDPQPSPLTHPCPRMQ
jgi:hypothetical protein